MGVRQPGVQMGELRRHGAADPHGLLSIPTLHAVGVSVGPEGQPGGSKGPNTPPAKWYPKAPWLILGHRKPQHLPFAFSLQAEATDVGNFRMSHLDAASLMGRKFGLESKAVPSSTSDLHVGQQEAMVGHQTSIGPCWAPTATCPTAFWPHTAPQ